MIRETKFRSRWPIAASLLCLLGCATGSTSNTARTATEQILLSNAVDQALDKVNFSYFEGTNVFLQDKYIECVDKNYVIASTRHRLLASGASLVDSADKADVVVEVRAGAVGTSSANSFIGTPEIALPGMLTIPEVKLAERRRQNAVAKLGMVAYDPKTNTVLGAGGMSLSNSMDNNWFIAGMGPYQTGAVRNEIQAGTTGSASKVQNAMPHRVAFARPTPTQEDPTQIAQEPTGKSTVNPASHSAPAEAAKPAAAAAAPWAK